LKLDSSGNVQWQRTYGGSSWDYAHSVQQTDDGGYIVAGGTLSFGAGGWDLWVLKLRSDGGIVFRSGAGASVNDTGAIVRSPVYQSESTSAAPQDSGATAAATDAVPQDTNATIHAQTSLEQTPEQFLLLFVNASILLLLAQKYFRRTYFNRIFIGAGIVLAIFGMLLALLSKLSIIAFPSTFFFFVLGLFGVMLRLRALCFCFFPTFSVAR